jgi:hypothetical protein
MKCHFVPHLERSTFPLGRCVSQYFVGKYWIFDVTYTKHCGGKMKGFFNIKRRWYAWLLLGFND